MKYEIPLREPLVFKLQLHQLGNNFFVGANTDRLAEAEPLALTAKEIKGLALLGERLAAEHLCRRSAVEEAGESLFSTIFRGSVLETFLRVQQEADSQERGLRILISLPLRTILHEIPWEILRQGGRYLVCSGTSLARCLSLPTPAPSLACSPPLRMLFTTAEPEEGDEVKLEAEEEAVRQGVAASNGFVRLMIRRRVSCETLIETFQAARRNGDPFRIWHHGGHGCITRSGQFHLVLEENRKEQLVEAARIARFLAAGNDLKLAVLSLCFGGMSLGLGVHLARLGVPVAVGFRSAVVNSATIGFARSFYKDLAAVPVDLAVARARSSLGVDDDLDWAQPILYARAASLSLWTKQAPNSSMRPNTGSAITVHNRGVKVKETTEQMGRVFAGEGSPRAASPPQPVDFINEDLQTGKFKQIGELHLGHAGTFAERWSDLLSFVASGKG